MKIEHFVIIKDININIKHNMAIDNYLKQTNTIIKELMENEGNVDNNIIDFYLIQTKILNIHQNL